MQKVKRMPNHVATVSWTSDDNEAFRCGRYSRAYTMAFDGGARVEGSASPHVVGKWANQAAVDPEEMLIAALSSCHMLTFLHVVRLAGFTVASYRDRAEGIMEDVAPGRQAVTRVTLHPEITWIGGTPGEARLHEMHHAAHEACFIANSVRTKIVVARQT